MNESLCNPLQPHTQTRTHMQLQSEILYSFSMKQREKKQATYRAQITSDYIHIDAKSQMLKKTFSEVFFMQTTRQRCSQMETVSHRWKVTSFLPLSLSLALSPSSYFPSFFHPLPLSSSLHFHAFSLLLLLPLPLIRSLHSASLCFFFFCFFLFPSSLFGLSIFPPSALLSKRKLELFPAIHLLSHWCLHRCHHALFLFCFLPPFFFVAFLHPTLIQPHIHKHHFYSCPVSRLRNSQCIVGLDACISVCVQCERVLSEMTLQSKEDRDSFGA